MSNIKETIAKGDLSTERPRNGNIMSTYKKETH